MMFSDHKRGLRTCVMAGVLAMSAVAARADEAMTRALHDVIAKQEWMDQESKGVASQGVERALKNAPDLGSDKLTHAPRQFEAWLRNAWMPNAAYIKTAERRGVMGELTEVSCTLMRELPATNDTARNYAKAQTHVVAGDVEAFVNSALSDTPADVRAQVALAAKSVLLREADSWGDYFRPTRHSWNEGDKPDRDAFFSFARRPHFFLDHASTMFAQTRQLLAQPGMTEQSKAFFTKQYVDRASQNVSRAGAAYMDEFSRRALGTHLESLRAIMSKDLRDREQAMMRAIYDEAKADAERDAKEAATPIGDKVRKSIGTTSTGGVPQGPK